MKTKRPEMKYKSKKLQKMLEMQARVNNYKQAQQMLEVTEPNKYRYAGRSRVERKPTERPVQEAYRIALQLLCPEEIRKDWNLPVGVTIGEALGYFTAVKALKSNKPHFNRELREAIDGKARESVDLQVTSGMAERVARARKRVIENKPKEIEQNIENEDELQ